MINRHLKHRCKNEAKPRSLWYEIENSQFQNDVIKIHFVQFRSFQHYDLKVTGCESRVIEI